MEGPLISKLFVVTMANAACVQVNTNNKLYRIYRDWEIYCRKVLRLRQSHLFTYSISMTLTPMSALMNLVNTRSPGLSDSEDMSRHVLSPAKLC